MGGSVILPLLDGGTVHDYEIVTEWMLKGTLCRQTDGQRLLWVLPQTAVRLARRIYLRVV
jgi:hypothetical protein